MAEKTIQVVVIGGGAGGLPLVRKLCAHFGRERYDTILIDRSRSHIWNPLLHEVAAGRCHTNYRRTENDTMIVR